MSRVDWTPVDVLADIIAELAEVTKAPQPRSVKTNGVNGTIPLTNGVTESSTIPVYHTVNPRSIQFSALVPTITSYLGPSIKIVSYADWISKMKASARSISPEAIKRNPGLKI